MPPSVSTMIGLFEPLSFGKFELLLFRLQHRLGVAERDPLDRAFSDLKAVVLPQLGPSLGERLVGGEIDDCPLQRA